LQNRRVEGDAMRFGWIVVVAACTGGGATKDSGGTGHTGTVPAEDWQLQSWVDAGVLCFEVDGTGVTVRVDPQECLSSSCSRAFQGSCSATVKGTAITVTSDISWEQNVAEGATCTDDCGSTAVECTLPALADGTYTVTFGTQQSELVVPITADCPPY
jgi:hypothetical protein